MERGRSLPTDATPAIGRLRAALGLAPPPSVDPAQLPATRLSRRRRLPVGQSGARRRRPSRLRGTPTGPVAQRPGPSVAKLPDRTEQWNTAAGAATSSIYRTSTRPPLRASGTDLARGGQAAHSADGARLVASDKSCWLERVAGIEPAFPAWETGRALSVTTAGTRIPRSEAVSTVHQYPRSTPIFRPEWHACGTATGSESHAARNVRRLADITGRSRRRCFSWSSGFRRASDHHIRNTERVAEPNRSMRAGGY